MVKPSAVKPEAVKAAAVKLWRTVLSRRGPFSLTSSQLSSAQWTYIDMCIITKL